MKILARDYENFASRLGQLARATKIGLHRQSAHAPSPERTQLTYSGNVGIRRLSPKVYRKASHAAEKANLRVRCYSTKSI